MFFLAATLVGWIPGDFVYSDHYTEHDHDHNDNDDDNDHTSDHQSVINN